MNDSTRMQLDIILKGFNRMKNDNAKLKRINESLKLACSELNERLKKWNRKRHDIIKVFKENSVQKEATIQSLQRDNNNFLVTVQEQQQQIEELNNTIDKLKKELAGNNAKEQELVQKQVDVEPLKEENNRLKNVLLDKDKEITQQLRTIDKLREEVHKLNNEKETLAKRCQQNCGVRNKTNGVKKLKIKKDSNQLNFSHPSFEENTRIIAKTRKIQSLSQFRWTNLDIQINGEQTKTEETSPNKLKFEKKRKLYCPDDGTVDLTNEV